MRRALTRLVVGRTNGRRKGRNVIKMLKRAIGTRRKGFGLIGRVDQSGSGKSIIEVGTPNDDGSWTKIPNGGHIALDPSEREDLIGVLKSHREYRMIELGDTVGVGLTVLAVQYLNATADDGLLRGTVLAWNGHKKEYAVLTADPYGDVHHGTYTSDSQRALNAYITRVNEHLYTHFNASPPSITFGHVAERDKLRSDA